ETRSRRRSSPRLAPRATPRWPASRRRFSRPPPRRHPTPSGPRGDGRSGQLTKTSHEIRSAGGKEVVRMRRSRMDTSWPPVLLVSFLASGGPYVAEKNRTRDQECGRKGVSPDASKPHGSLLASCSPGLLFGFRRPSLVKIRGCPLFVRPAPCGRLARAPPP